MSDEVPAFCGTCGAPRGPGRFCGDCGHRLGPPEPEATPSDESASETDGGPRAPQTREELKDAVVEAFEAGARIGAQDDTFVKLAVSAMKTVGLTLVEQLAPGDRPRVAVPVMVDTGRKPEPGALLTLDERVVVAWFEGTLRAISHARTIRLDQITDISSSRRKPGRMQVEVDCIAVSYEGKRIEILLHSPSHKRLLFMVKGFLDGSVTVSDTSLEAESEA